MARIVEIAYYCDRTQAGKHQPRTVQGETLLLWQRDLDRFREIDICETCQPKLTDTEAQALAKSVGRDPVEPEHDPDLVCPHGCNDGRPYKSKGGKSKHMSSTHPEGS